MFSGVTGGSSLDRQSSRSGVCRRTNDCSAQSFSTLPDRKVQDSGPSQCHTPRPSQAPPSGIAEAEGFWTRVCMGIYRAIDSSKTVHAMSPVELNLGRRRNTGINAWSLFRDLDQEFRAHVPGVQAQSSLSPQVPLDRANGNGTAVLQSNRGAEQDNDPRNHYTSRHEVHSTVVTTGYVQQSLWAANDEVASRRKHRTRF